MPALNREYGSPQFLKDESVKIATYLVNKRLGKKQKSYRIGDKLYELCSEMENERESFFSNVCTRLNLNRENLSESSTAVMDNVFTDGCNFGRIVALFTFCLTLSMYCAENDELVDQIDTVIDNTAITLVNQREWFENEGSWVNNFCFNLIYI